MVVRGGEVRFYGGRVLGICAVLMLLAEGNNSSCTFIKCVE